MKTGRMILVATTLLLTVIAWTPEAAAIECEGSIWPLQPVRPSLHCYQCLPDDLHWGECVRIPFEP